MNVIDAYCYVDKLKSTLSIQERVEEVSEEFKNLKDNAERIKYLEFLLVSEKIMPNSCLKSDKNEELANAYRIRGNEKYQRKNFLGALELYNRSLCFTPFQSNSGNMSMVHANRSAVYFELKLFSKSYDNAQEAINYGYKNVDKLKERMKKCEEKLKKDTSHQLLLEPISPEFFKLSHKPKSEVPFIADCLELKASDSFGRYVVTTKKLNPGEIIAIEEPFSKCLLKNESYKYCCNCLKDHCLNLIPCPNCTQAMFCSIECLDQAMYKFHRFECSIADILNKVCSKIMRIAVHTLFESLAIFNFNVLELRNALNETNDAPSTVFDHNLSNSCEPKTVKTRLLSTIDSLMTNESARSNADLFQRSGIVAIMTHLFLNYTKLKEIFNTSESQDFFRRFIFKQTQIAAINYHGIFDGIMTKSQSSICPQYASGSFPFCSLINHSCAPNVVRVSFRTKNYIMVNRPIDVGEQLFDNYGFHHCLESLAERQSSLRQQYMFKCGCIACVKSYPLFAALPRVDKNFDKFIGDDVAALTDMNFETAKNRFKTYCSYLSKMDAKYPCYEISCLQECLLRCSFIFKTSPFKFKLLQQD